MMKKTFIKLLMAVALVGTMASCSDDDKTTPKVNIEESSVTVDSSQPGKVVFHWKTPENADFYYIKVAYDDPVKGHRVLNASTYADSIMIDGLYAKYGELAYSFTAVSEDGGEKALFTKTAKAGYVPADIKDYEVGPISLTAAQLWTDDQESSEGPISALVDGNNDNPKKMTILASNNVGDNPDAAGAWEIGKLGSDVLPSGRAPEYTSPGLFSETEFQYLWLQIDEAYSGSKWIAMAELSIKEMTRSIYDPENEK